MCVASFAAASTSSASGVHPFAQPSAAVTRPSRRNAPASASNDSARRSRASATAAWSSAAPVSTARNSASCWVAQPDGAVTASGERGDDEGLVVEAVDPARPRDLAVRVEPGDGRAGREICDATDLGHDPFLAEDTLAGDAVEREQPERRAAPAPGPPP